MHSFKKIRLMENLKSLSNEYRVAFAASCCERLVANYDAFWVIEKWGDPLVLHEALDKVWAYVAGISFEREAIEALIVSCNIITPDTEDFHSIFTDLAVNSAATVIYSLRYIIERNLEELTQVGNLAVESIQSYLSAVNDPKIGVHSADRSFDDWLAHAPLLVAEINKQSEDIQFLKSWQGNNLELIQILRQTSKTIGIQPFARGIFRPPEA